MFFTIGLGLLLTLLLFVLTRNGMIALIFLFPSFGVAAIILGIASEEIQIPSLSRLFLFAVGGVVFVGVVMLVSYVYNVFVAKEAIVTYRGQPIEEAGATVPDPPRFKDGTVAAMKILYMDKDGCYASPCVDEKWTGDHMGKGHGKGVCAVNMHHPNAQRMLDYYAKWAVGKGYEPLSASISMYGGQVDLLDGGEMIAPEADIVSICNYYG